MGLTQRWPLRGQPAAGLCLRPALPQDGPALGTILADWAEATPWMPRAGHGRAEAAAHGALLIARTRVTVACLAAPSRFARASRSTAPPHAPQPLHSAPLGFLAQRGEVIHALYLAANARRQGLGSALLQQARRSSPRLTLWVFATNHAARAFYARHGFEVVEEGDGSGNDEGLPELRLEWRRADMGAPAAARPAAPRPVPSGTAVPSPGLPSPGLPSLGLPAPAAPGAGPAPDSAPGFSLPPAFEPASESDPDPERASAPSFDPAPGLGSFSGSFSGLGATARREPVPAPSGLMTALGRRTRLLRPRRRGAP